MKLSKINTNKLSVFKPNFFWETGGPYEDVNFIRLAWEIELVDNSVIYIDAETGENLGGTHTLSAARAVSTVPSTDSTNHKNVTDAAAALTRLGYEQPNAPVTYYISQSDINWIMNSAPYYAMYLRAHGDNNTTIIADSTDLSTANWSFTASSLNSNSLWYFVFLDACYSGKKDTWFKAFLCSNRSKSSFNKFKINIPSAESALCHTQ